MFLIIFLNTSKFYMVWERNPDFWPINFKLFSSKSYLIPFWNIKIGLYLLLGIIGDIFTLNI